ncbi:hypothetical protein WIS52_31160 [Pseudonocardia nematodicida]|uniref:Uncharacterized protein n=1 Tax=Pseudonocardia nematodicida TaxID=1206997 RepID=A0ABV1KM53_9PSEU
MPLFRARVDPLGELRPALAMARMDCAEALSSQVDAVARRAVRRPGRSADPAWWATALEPAGTALDDDWARRCGPALRRAYATVSLGRTGAGMAYVIHPPSRSGAPLLASAAAGALPRSSVRRIPPGRRAPRVTGATLTGTLLPVWLGSGSLVSGVLGLRQVVATAGPGLALALAGLVLVIGAVTLARVRTVRAARADELARRVRAAVLAAADRELLRRTLAVERAVRVPAPAGAGPRRAGAGRAA